MKKQVLPGALILSFLTFFQAALRVLLAAGLIALSACASNSAATGADELNPALRETSDYLNGKLDKGAKVVFLNFKSDYPYLSEYVINRLIENTVNDGNFTAVDRQNLALIQQEMDFQLSGEVSDDTAQSIGQKLGAQIIVSGSISPLGDLYLFSVRAIGVEGAEIRGQFNRDIPNGSRIAALTQNSAAGGSRASTGNAGSKSSATPAPAQTQPAPKPAPAQTLPRLAVIPFAVPSQSDGEAVANLFAGQRVLRDTFSVIPRTAVSQQAISMEMNLQRSGLTDTDSIFAYGQQLNAEFVVAGHILTLGDHKLVLVTIFDVKSLQQIAGDYRQYSGDEAEIRGLLPAMAKKLADATKNDTRNLPKLSVVPFTIRSAVDASNAQVLVRLLATDIANSGKYTVFPRTESLEQVQREYENEISGLSGTVTMAGGGGG